MENKAWLPVWNVYGMTWLGQVESLQDCAQAMAKRLQVSRIRDYTVVMFDVDGLDALQGRYGAVRTEQLLEELASIMVNQPWQQCLVARVKQCFVVMLQNRTASFALLQQVLLGEITERCLERYLGRIEFSFGVYQIEQQDVLFTDALTRAQAAHQAASASYKTFIYYNDTLLLAMAQDVYCRDQAQEGLEKQEFKVYLQRQMVLDNPSQIRAIAFSRWALPDGRLLYPNAFIPQFEKNGVMPQFDFYMIEQVCQYLHQMKGETQAQMVISVNVSPITLIQPEFEQRFLGLLAQYELPVEAVVLEIQKAAWLLGEQSALERLSRLGEKGVVLVAQGLIGEVIDLRLLVRLPVQYFKIDRTFTCMASYDKRIESALECIIKMAHGMSIKVICEGVEQQRDVERLQRFGCDVMQGHYFMQVVPKEEFMPLVKRMAPRAELGK